METDRSDSDAQASRNENGRMLEENVVKILNEFLNVHGIHACKGTKGLKELVNNDVDANRILDYTKIPMNRWKCNQKQLDTWPDIDIYMLVESRGTWMLIACISCMVSLRERYAKAAFWGSLVKTSSGIPYFLVTEDDNDELGTCIEPRQARIVLENCMTRIYTIKHYYTDDPSMDQDIARKHELLDGKDKTITFDDPVNRFPGYYCSLVADLDCLIDDLSQIAAECRKRSLGTASGPRRAMLDRWFG